MVPRGVVAIKDGRTVVHPAESMELRAAGVSRPGAPLSVVPATISEAKLYEMLDAKLPGEASRLQELLQYLKSAAPVPASLLRSLCCKEQWVTNWWSWEE